MPIFKCSLNDPIRALIVIVAVFAVNIFCLVVAWTLLPLVNPDIILVVGVLICVMELCMTWYILDQYGLYLLAGNDKIIEINDEYKGHTPREQADIYKRHLITEGKSE
jgi:presenilin-like A22 family membrane protease